MRRDDIARWFRANAGWLRWVLLAAAWLLLVWVKSRRVLRTPQLWAEDGVVFFQGAQDSGWGSLLEPYSGYLSTWMRLVALAAQPFAIEVRPALYLAGAVALCIGAGLYTYWRFPDRRVAVLAAICPLFILDLHGEMWISLTYTQWVVFPALLCAVASPSVRPRLIDFVVVVFGALTGPFIVFLLPVVVVRLVSVRDLRTRVLLACALAAGVVQFVLSRHAPAMAPREMGWLDVAGATAFRASVGLVLPPSLWPSLPAVVSVMIFAGLAAFLANLAWRSQQRLYCLAALLVGSGALFGGAMRWGHEVESFYLGAHVRYFFGWGICIAHVLLIGALAGRRWMTRTSWAVLVCLAVSSLFHLTAPARPNLDWAGQVSAIPPGQERTVAINPPGWSVLVCRK